MVRFIRHWAAHTGLSVVLLVGWLGIALSKFSRWDRRQGTPNRHNAPIPRHFWLEDWEKAAIVAFQDRYPLEGYRRLAYMMMDADVVAVSPSSVYRVLKAAGKLAPRGGAPSKKGTGFEQPVRPHEHWHIDVSYLNICGTFFFLCSILDGYSRSLLHWEIRETMTEAEVETILQRARAVPRRAPADHLRQRAAVHRQGLQGVHPPLRDDSRQDFSLLSPEQRQDGAVVQDPERRVHPRQDAPELGRRSAPGRRICGALQHGSPAQRDRLRDASGQAGRS